MHREGKPLCGWEANPVDFQSGPCGKMETYLCRASGTGCLDRKTMNSGQAYLLEARRSKSK